MTIGRLAKVLGVNVETIRYYQRRGLIEEPQRPSTGYRKYTALTIARMHFIRRAQQLGFSLADVERLIKLEDGRSCREVRLIAEDKYTALERQIAELERMRHSLEKLIDACKSNRSRKACPIITLLVSTAAI
ncbi:MAG: MerR family transcriptional regulator [Pseudomonadota bacterium]|nr:MerR family transcriptional regulator [Pseudomonadota bacterium]